MIVVEHQRIELDYCPACRGVWFDADELELLLDTLGFKQDEFLKDTLSTPEAMTVEKKRRCPICSRHMKKANIGTAPAILIDICAKGHGLWFDGGEMAHLIKQMPEPGAETPAREINAFLKDIFQAAGPSGEAV